MRRSAAVLALGCLALLLSSCSDGDGSANTTVTTGPSTTALPTTTSGGRSIEVQLEGGKVVGGPRTETVAVGSQVVIVATSDVAEELHVHTYDLKVDLEPGKPGQVAFIATIPGRHEVEFEKSGRQALTLEVR